LICRYDKNVKFIKITTVNNRWVLLQMKKYMLDVSDYDISWPNLFEKERARLLQKISGYDVTFEHIGGTSITGLAAKPIIDIALGIEDFSLAELLVKKIQSLEYNYEPDMVDIYPGFKFLWKGQKLNGSFDIHMYHVSIQSRESDSWKNTLLFRNYLRTHPESAEAYAKLKKKLSGQYLTDNARYTKDKSSFIQQILLKAKQCS
jgi:GrpB-like predicted nucleotidyltransferase (UPF0157 family)